MKRIFLLASLFALQGYAAHAAIDSNGLIASYQAEGYTTIEVTRGTSQTKVEAIKGDTKVEVIYDNETGNVLKSERGQPEAGDDINDGVSVRDVDRDFVRDGGSTDDDEADDSNDDDSNDEGDDDDNGDDDNGSDEGGDDNGSDEGGDDNGGDDNGGDEGGDDNAGDEGGDDNGGDHDGGDSGEGGDHDGGDSEGNDD